jgi:hypothetical protein
MLTTIPTLVGFARAPWNKDRLTGQKRPLKPKEVWTIRVRLQLEWRRRDLALFNLAIDSKLRGCDLVRLRVNDVCVGDRVHVKRHANGTPDRHPIGLFHAYSHAFLQNLAEYLIVYRWWGMPITAERVSRCPGWLVVLFMIPSRLERMRCSFTCLRAIRIR